MTDETVFIRVPANRITRLPNGSYLVDTGKTAEEILLMLSYAVCYPGKVIED